MSSDEMPDDTAGLFVRRTREDWLLDAIDKLRLRFKECAGVILPEHIQISVGFGYGARAENKSVNGQAWATWKSDDHVNQLFLSPEVSDPVEVLAILTHLLVHVWDDCEHEHKGPFREIASKLGFNGRMTEIYMTDELRDALQWLAFELGAYPHGRLDVLRVREVVAPDGDLITIDRGTSTPRKQNARMIKLECKIDGYLVRTTKRHLEAGLPYCPNLHQMVITDPNWEG